MGLIIKQVLTFLVHVDLANEENQDIIDECHYVKQILPDTCLFKLIVKNNEICNGGHEKKAEAVKCVSTALKYSPFYCWFCYKAGNEGANFTTKGDLVEH